MRRRYRWRRVIQRQQRLWHRRYILNQRPKSKYVSDGLPSQFRCGHEVIWRMNEQEFNARSHLINAEPLLEQLQCDQERRVPIPIGQMECDVASNCLRVIMAKRLGHSIDRLNRRPIDRQSFGAIRRQFAKDCQYFILHGNSWVRHIAAPLNALSISSTTFTIGFQPAGGIDHQVKRTSE
ncbi:MAG: hypothetical protein JWN40_4826 [Phycisphaerales bacterium]|nr:hypothetical protein [Phycisphaerales bacterium]